MLPSTRALYDYLRRDGTVVEEPENGFEPEPDSGVDVQSLTLQMKKKRQQMMLKRMLSDAGYGDLSKMVTIGRSKHEAPDPDDGVG